VRTQGRAGQDLVVLLPDPSDGTVGRATVSTPAGTQELGAARESTLVAPNKPPAPIVVMSEADAQQLFGDTLSALPPAARHFTLYFRFESDELTDESRALVPAILQAVKDRPFPDVAVVGHTDTTGTPPANYELGLRRANAIRRSLINAQIAASVIEATSHGEADPLIKTADGVLEPRNRRVEITVR
jgi:outer membrane protein OmpA-like peptidoglycan-associated protein